MTEKLPSILCRCGEGTTFNSIFSSICTSVGLNEILEAHNINYKSRDLMGLGAKIASHLTIASEIWIFQTYGPPWSQGVRITV